MENTLKKTPLHPFHLQNGARMVPFAGWEMPVQYTSILDEHKAVREQMGLFDVSHMGEMEIVGPGAEAFIDRLVTNRVSGLAVGKAVYALMCYEDGGVVDDLIIYRLESQRFLLCLNAGNTEKDVEWITGQAVGAECQLKDVSDQWAQIAIQGPKAIAFLESLLDLSLDNVKRFEVRSVDLFGSPVLIARTGYTGEDGAEIYLPNSCALTVTEQLYDAGKAMGLMLCGLGCRDSLRLEAGYPLYGHEIDSNINPLEAGLGWTVKWKKEVPFIGQKTLEAVRAEGPSRKIVHFLMPDRRIARSGTEVLNEAKDVVGRVVSGSLSPFLNRGIGSALTASNEADNQLFVDLRGKLLPLEKKNPPLHQ